MKIVLIDNDCRFDTHSTYVLEHLAIDKFIKVDCNGHSFCYSCIDDSSVGCIFPGDGEMHISFRGTERYVVCDGVFFLDDDQNVSYFIHDEFDCRTFSEEEIDVTERREKAVDRERKIKNGISYTIDSMLGDGSIVPSFPNDITPIHPIEEFAALYAYVMHGVSCMRNYISIMTGIDASGIKMFTVKDYEFPFVAVCVPLDRESEFGAGFHKNLRALMENIDCVPMVTGRSDIRWKWEDCEHKSKRHNAIVYIYQYCRDASSHNDSVVLNGVRECGSICSIDRDGISVNLPGMLVTRSGKRTLSLIENILSEKFRLDMACEQTRRLIDEYIMSLLNADYGTFGDGGKFLYRKN